MAHVDPVIDRAFRARADLRRRWSRAGSAGPALRSFGRPSRRNLDEWHRRTSEGHERYRAEHPPVSRSAAVVCVTMRPHLVDLVVANVTRQTPGLELEFVFVATHPDFDRVELEQRFESIGRARMIRADPGTSLGAGLNLGLEATDERFVAKFDDDDWYGPGYLVDMLRAHGYAGAGVVGKHSYYADVESDGGRYLRFAGHEFRYSGTLAGGTLVIDRDRVGDLRFEEISLGEDRAFLAACHRRGASTFSADRFNFVQSRRHDNTWAISQDDFLIGTLAVDRDADVHRVGR